MSETSTNAYPVDSTSHTLPNGQTVIGRDAYEAEMTKAVFKLEETTATEVYAHALDHGDRPVIHGTELDYDDVHDGIHYHADLLKAAEAEYDRSQAAMNWAADKVSIRAMLAADEDVDPREYGTGWAEEVAEYSAARDAWFAAGDRTHELRAKRDQDADLVAHLPHPKERA